MMTMERLLDQAKWTRIIWPDQVEPGQYWTHKRTGQEVRVMEVDDEQVAVLKESYPPRSWLISRVGLCKRYVVVQESIREELRRLPPWPKQGGRP